MITIFYYFGYPLTANQVYPLIKSAGFNGTFLWWNDGHRLMALHLHDNNGVVTEENEDDQHRLPYDGTINWSAIMKRITKKGYSGATSLEVTNLGYENLSPEEFLNLAFERAKRLEIIQNELLINCIKR